MIGRRNSRGWRVRLRIEVLRGRRQWATVPSEIGADGVRHPGLSYRDAERLAEFHAARGRVVKLLDPDGAEGPVVPKKHVDVNAWRLTML